MTEPVVSVIVLTYNQRNYLASVLQGIFIQQVDGPVEIIIADDCSTDGTSGFLKMLLQEVSSNFQIRYCRHETNKGAVNNLIWALQQASSSNIAICDGDDYWTHPLKLRKQLEAFDLYPKSVFCFHDGWIEDSSGKRTDSICAPELSQGKFDAHEFVSGGGGVFPTSSVMIKSRILSNIPKYFYRSPGSVTDLPLALLAVSQGEIIYLEDKMMVYREMAQNSWSAQLTKKMRISVYSEIKAMISEFNRVTGGEFLRSTTSFLKKEYVKILTFTIVDAPYLKLPHIYREAISDEGCWVVPSLMRSTLYKIKCKLRRSCNG